MQKETANNADNWHSLQNVRQKLETNSAGKKGIVQRKVCRDKMSITENKQN